MFGWIAAGHQIGAASATAFAGWMRDWQGNYLQAFVIAGMTGIVAAVLSLMIARHGHTARDAVAAGGASRIALQRLLLRRPKGLALA